MPSMDAILRIRARAEGTQEVAELDRAMRRLGPGADSAAPGVGRLNQMLSEMGTIAGGIGLAGLGAGLLRFGRDSIVAGDEAVRFQQRLKVLADRFGETSQMMDFITKASDRYSIGLLETGDAFSFLYAASREMVSGGAEVQTTFSGIMNLARQVGLPIHEAREAMRQWTQSIGEGRLNGQEYISMMQRLPMLNKLLVRAFNELRQESGQPLLTKEKADQMVAAVKDGEKRQTEEIKKGILDRKNAAERETNDLLRELERRYERQRRIMGDRNEDIDNAERNARDKRAEDEREAIELRYAQQRKAYERNYEDAREQFLQENKDISDEALKEIERRSEDQKEHDLRRLDEQKEMEVEALQKRLDAEATQRTRALRDQRRQEEEALEERQRTEETGVREALEKKRQELDFDLKRQVDANSKANEEIIAGILSRVQVTEGQLKKLAEEGKISLDVMNRVMQIASKETNFPAATPLDRLTKSMSDLQLEIGDNLQPLMKSLADNLDLLVRGFSAFSEPLQATAIGMIAIGGAMVGLRALLGTVGQVKDLTNAFRGLSGAAKAAQVVESLPSLGRTSLNPFNVKQITPPVVAPPPPGLFKGLLSEAAKATKAFGSLTKEVGLFALEFVRHVPAMSREFMKAIPGMSRLGAAAAPAAAAIRVAFTGVITWMATTFVPAMVGFFSGPVGWIALGVAALIAGMIFFREPIMNFLGWAIEEIKKFWQGVFDYIYNERVKPWVDLWNNILKAPVTKFVDDMKKNMQNAWTSIMEWTDKNFVKRFQDLWVNITKSPETFKNTVIQWFIDLQNNIVKRWENVAAALQSIWDNVTRYVGNGWRQMMDGIKNVLNDAIKLWNFIASKTQGLPKFAQLPLIPQIGTPPESFARGGFVSQPTLAMLGDGANPNEYAIPEDMMPAAVAGWQAGLRGPALVTALQSSGLAPGSSLPAATMTATMAGGGAGGAAVGGGGGMGPIQITVTGGTVTLPDGREMVTLAQAREIAIATVQAAAPGLVRASVQASGQLQRSAAGRSSYGLS